MNYHRRALGEIDFEERVQCPICLGDYKNCKLEKCPFLKNVRDILLKLSKTRVLYGSSPPSTLVGSWGYPRVSLGPLVPPFIEDTSIMERQDLWLDMPLEKILSMRLSMVYGKKRVKVYDARNPDRLLQTIQELALSHQPVDVEMFLEKEPKINLKFSVRTTPVCPTATMEKIQLAHNPSTLHVIEETVSDTDLKVSEAALRLYLNGVREYNITRLLSLGLLGTKYWRRIVPMEWSITAVDDLLGRRFRKYVKMNQWITKYRVYCFEAHYNRITILMMPGPWSFEVIEIWSRLNNYKIYVDSELPGEVDKYPESVGGAYHALRLPVLEKLYKEGRQASVLVIAEISEGWIPLGVWRFREICRRALQHTPTKFNILKEALEEVEKKTLTGIKYWKSLSRILKFHEFQERITE